MLLGLKTDNPEAELYLLSADGTLTDKRIWHADRQLARELLARIEDLLGSNSLGLRDLSGLVLFRGPGSFTGLRIGAAVANTLSYGLELPIVGSEGEGWLQNGVEHLRFGTNDRVVLPNYGAPARITAAKK